MPGYQVPPLRDFCNRCFPLPLWGLTLNKEGNPVRHALNSDDETPFEKLLKVPRDTDVPIER